MQNITAVVFTSNTGFTAHFASLLGEATRLPFYPLEHAARHLPAGAPVVYLGWLCAGSLKGYKKAARQFEVKAACAVGMAPQGMNSMEELAGHMGGSAPPLFYLQGGYDGQQLTGIYKLMMGFVARAVPKNAPDEKGRAMAEAMRNGADWVTPEQLAPVLDWMGFLS